MNFVSIHFWLHLSCLLAGYLAVRFFFGKKWRASWDRPVLLFFSLFLFFRESLLSFGIFLAVAFWVFGAVRVLPRVSPAIKWWYVAFCVFVALQPLLFYKYWAPGEASILIPIGISFYTFQLVGLLVDSARRGDSQFSLLDFLNFSSFFPQIVAGPIERRDSLLPQVKNFRFRYRPVDFEAGLRFVILGFFYKLVLADNIASASSWIVRDIENPWVIHVSNALFGMRIYFDFCGYSLIAFGIARVMGIKLTQNFLAPYAQRNIQQFWRAWHVSLSQWFRDYVYLPLGGNQAKHPAMVLLVVFLVSGVWHGAGWNYVLWGAAHGLLLVLFRKMGTNCRLPALLSWALTMFFVSTTWLFFYQENTEILWSKLGQLVTLSGYLVNPSAEFLSLARNMGNVGYFLAAGFAGCLIIMLEWLSLRKTDSPYKWSQYNWVQVLMVISLVWMTPIEDNGFVYFNF